ncbi:MAG: hypothetical protein GY847_38650 [Proteobacteria bacterium]|nr:hypothetical protein [Pseudomonadota bacterium]
MRFLIVLICLACMCLACAPKTRYRREALVPGPQAPPYRGEPLGQKHMEFQGQIAGNDVLESLAIPHDPALWIPRFHFNASAMFGLLDFMDLGLLVTYAHGTWARYSAFGTPPMPSGGKHLFALGPQLGIAFKGMDGKIFGGGYLSTQYVRIPWSEWELDGEIIDGKIVPEHAWYELRNDGTDHDIYYRIGAYFGGRPLQWLALNVGFVLSDSWINDGFSDTPSSGSTLEHGGPTVMPVFGARFDIEMMFIETFITVPLSTEEAIDFMPFGWSFGAGVRI